MTTIHEVVKTCMHCGEKNKFEVVGSTSSFGQPDLDTRPAPLARQTVQYGVQRCSKCNYASDDIEEEFEFDDSILTSENYLKVLKSDYPDVAKNYILASMIKESVMDYNEAAVFMLEACWVLDDHNVNAKKPRIIAAELFEKSVGIETSRLIAIDLYRRAEEFDKAKVLINKSKEFIEDKFLKKLLLFQETLVDIFDSECHSCSEIGKFIGEDELMDNGLSEDTMEEIEMKLFDPDCKEPIYKIVQGKRVGFQQIALIPLDENGKREVYTILHPEDMEVEDEALVFKLVGNEKLEELEFIRDDDVIDKVFDEYYRLVEESHN